MSLTARGYPAAPEGAHITVDARMLGNFGIGTYLGNILPRMIARRPSWQFTLLGQRDRLQRMAWTDAPNVVIEGMAAPVYGVREQLELARRRRPRGRGPALFWTPHYNIPLFYSGKLLVTVHDVLHLARPDLLTPAQRVYARWFLSAVRRKASGIICVSQFTRGELLRLTGAGAGETDPAVVHSGIDPSWFANPPAGDLPTPRPYILYVGNLKPHKNVNSLVQAFASITSRVPHDLVIAGANAGRAESASGAALRRLVASAGAEGRIVMTGQLSSDQLRRYVANADVFVMPSTYEGFGFPPIEAMAAGVPCAVSTAAALPEICGDAAVYFDPMDREQMAATIVGLLGNPGLRAELSQRGRRQAARYDWAVAADQTLAVVDTVLAGDSVSSAAPSISEREVAHRT